MPAPCANLTKQTGSTDLPSSNFKHFELSFQNPLHHSFIVLVRYRSHAYTLSFRWSVPPALRSTPERDIFQRVCICAHAAIASCQYKSSLKSLDVHAEPVPCHPPLLKEYCSVPFHPLTDVLIFSRFTGPTSCPRKKR